MKREHERPMAYEAPRVEVIEVMVEQGFAVSPGNGVPGNPDDFGAGGSLTS